MPSFLSWWIFFYVDLNRFFFLSGKKAWCGARTLLQINRSCSAFAAWNPDHKASQNPIFNRVLGTFIEKDSELSGPFILGIQLSFSLIWHLIVLLWDEIIFYYHLKLVKENVAFMDIICLQDLPKLHMFLIVINQGFFNFHWIVHVTTGHILVLDLNPMDHLSRSLYHFFKHHLLNISAAITSIIYVGKGNQGSFQFTSLILFSGVK